MFQREYSVMMRTPLGSRRGTMAVQIEQDRASGHLDILKGAEPFEGRVDENGYCRLAGRLVTLMQTIPYTATGHILPDSLNLLLRGGQNTFYITGSACPKDREA